MPNWNYEYWSIAPPLVAIGLAIVTRRILLSLGIGIFLGSLIVCLGQPQSAQQPKAEIVVAWKQHDYVEVSHIVVKSFPTAVVDFFEGRLWESLIDSDHMRVFAFTILMGCMVGVINRSGGMHGVVDKLSPFANTRRKGQFTTWLMGMVIFFDDYANTLLLGGTMKPLADRLKISREKLAYLVDSTAAPVAGLTLISTWVAVEIDYINQGIDAAVNKGAIVTQSGAGMDLFIQSIPYRFYVLFALFFVLMVAVTGRDFGAMFKAERKRQEDDGNQEQDNVNLKIDLDYAPDAQTPRRWFNAAIPVLMTLAVTVGLLLLTGRKPETAEDASWQELFVNGNSYIALLYGSLAGLISAIILSLVQKILTVQQTQRAVFRGMQLMLTALAILWLSWSLQSVIKTLDTKSFISDMIYQVNSDYTLNLMPTIIFILASAVAFATGSSWATMGVLMPLSISVTAELLHTAGGSDAVVQYNDPILLAAIGSVLAGAIFGDHCSPISDTTIMSSQASGCDHIAHVRTQMPYALVVGAATIIFGTLPVGFGVPVWPMLIVGTLALLGFLYLIGHRAED